jgi:hypothetical protein
MLPTSPGRSALTLSWCLSQAMPDLLCCDWDKVRLLQGAPQLQAAATLNATARGMAAALQSAAAVLQATARGDHTAAEAAAADVAAAAVALQQHAQQLPAAMTTAAGGTTAPAPAPLAQVDDQELSPPQHTSALDGCLEEDLGAMCAAAPALPAQDQQLVAPPASHLPRGTGLVLLLARPWGERSRQLPAAVRLGDTVFRHAALGLLTSRGGVVLAGDGQPHNSYMLRPSLEFASSSTASSSWGAQAVAPPASAHLLLALAAQQHVPGRLTSAHQLPGYRALYGADVDARITAALGKGTGGRAGCLWVLYSNLAHCTAPAAA